MFSEYWIFIVTVPIFTVTFLKLFDYFFPTCTFCGRYHSGWCEEMKKRDRSNRSE